LAKCFSAVFPELSPELEKSSGCCGVSLDSPSAVRLQAQIEEEFGIDLKVEGMESFASFEGVLERGNDVLRIRIAIEPFGGSGNSRRSITLLRENVVGPGVMSMEFSRASIAIRAHEIARRLTKQYGTLRLKGWLWDRDFSRGHYGPQGSEGDFLYPFLEKYIDGGCILDLGCGSGCTASELRADAYAAYIGVDISRVAIVKAKARTEQDGRSGKNHYLCADMQTYVPPHKFNVILFRDSIYYLPKARIKATLDRYSDFLHETGVLIVRLFDSSKKQIVDHIERNFTVIEREVSMSIDPNPIVLILRGAEQNAFA
jgi:SAM-dependent methyltransferase